MNNFMECTRYLNYPHKIYPYDEIIGPWFNLCQTASLYAWLGIIFGSSYCFRKMSNISWAMGPTKKRVLRAIVANLFIVPSWIFIIFLEERGSWMKDIGLNKFIIDSLHFFLLYLWLFGFMPVLLFKKTI